MTTDTTSTPTPAPPETAMNIGLTFEDIDLLHEAVIEWAAKVMPFDDTTGRINRFAAFVLRHSELFTAITVMKGARR